MDKQDGQDMNLKRREARMDANKRRWEERRIRTGETPVPLQKKVNSAEFVCGDQPTICLSMLFLQKFS